MTTRRFGDQVDRGYRPYPPTSPRGPAAVDLVGYREAVDNLLIELAGHGGPYNGGPSDLAKAETILAERLDTPELARVLAATPNGWAGSVERLLAELRTYRPSVRSSARDLAAQIRIYLLSQIEAMWWGQVTPYTTDVEVRTAPDLIDLAGTTGLPFRYRQQPSWIGQRAWRALERRIAPERTPRTAGLRFAYARPEMISLLGQLAGDFAGRAPAGTPSLWVTSLVRSVTHQRHLRDLGYAAMMPSSHCVGQAVDVEMAWFARFGARDTLKAVLVDRQATGDINVIDEGQAWHVCVSPSAVADLRREFGTHYRGEA